MSLESTIVELTEQIVRLTNEIASKGTTPTIEVNPAMDIQEVQKAANEKKLSAAKEKDAAKKKAKAEADAAIKKVAGKDKEPTAAQKAKAERDAKRQEEIDAETAEAAEQEVTETEVVDEPEATLEDCRVVATFIMKVKKDKAGLGSVLKKLGTKNISGYEGDPADFLAALEETAGKTLAEIKG